ncbi:MAG TPA: FMN-binding negative transcriptional regulator [Tepidisphaeraceae bacterium]|nr:FMN-binding negative transcriptional regulator [Tepidisphaeraceae bacterium]
MYVPDAFRESRTDVLHAMMREFGFATIVSHGPDGLIATPAPVVVDPTRGAFGTLRSHLARANPHAALLAAGVEAMVIFHGPHAYVSPTWYLSKVAVPTWNYVTVHAYGVARILSDAAEVARVLEETVNQYESGMERPWATAGLPADVAAGLRKQVVAFEIEITRLDGKWKLGQNRPAADRVAAAEALIRRGETAVGRMMLDAGG